MTAVAPPLQSNLYGVVDFKDFVQLSTNFGIGNS